ncbi:uncharacterized protein LOC110829610 [Zootermopsis nevadensis]|uniref:uncharacterized protein LOC110829610 n=1 Tax=Zootermopsis nevadensis TaxID=136037 RepID=UPI000B8E5F05|nr:uncharacterized protein LOC110829610 [Zootermopsis nevadensis]
MGNVRDQEHPAGDETQYHDVEQDSELDISDNTSDSDFDSDSDDSEGQASVSSGMRIKKYLQGMKKTFLDCLYTNRNVITPLMFLTVVLIGQIVYARRLQQ